MVPWLVALAFSAEPTVEGESVAPDEAPAEPGPAGEPAPLAAPPLEALSAVGLDTISPARHRIDAAISLYLAGETSQARRILTGVLVDGAGLAPVDRQDAYAWLGDILFSEQGISAAQSVLASLLAENLDYRMDPLAHPPEFCDAFERLRADLRAAPPKREKNPYPWTMALPFGAGYFIDGRPLPGLAFGTVQLGGLIVSVVTRVEITGIQDEVAETNSPPDRPRFYTLRAINGIAAGAGWAAWGVPLIVETARWSTARRPVKVTSVDVGPGTLGISGTF